MYELQQDYFLCAKHAILQRIYVPGLATPRFIVNESVDQLAEHFPLRDLTKRWREETILLNEGSPGSFSVSNNRYPGRSFNNLAAHD